MKTLILSFFLGLAACTASVPAYAQDCITPTQNILNYEKLGATMVADLTPEMLKKLNATQFSEVQIFEHPTEQTDMHVVFTNGCVSNQVEFPKDATEQLLKIVGIEKADL